MKRKERGITLIALVVTIIVLLILAGVSIQMITGQNGILSQAREAREKTNDKSQEEQERLDDLNTLIENYKNGTVTPTKPKNDPTDIFVSLYSDGTLVFSNNEEPIEGKTISQPYGNIKDKEFTYNKETEIADTPWYKDRLSITTVNFANKIVPTKLGGMFCDCTNLSSIQNIENLETSEVTTMYCMFLNCVKLTSLDVSKFDTSKVTDMAYMFGGRHSTQMSLTEIKGIEDFKTGEVTNMHCMFYNCVKLTSLDVSKFDTSKVTDMSWMFAGGESNVMSLTEIKGIEDFKTGEVTNMEGMFQNCVKLISLDLSNFDTSKVTDMAYMFSNCSSLKNIYIGQGWNLTNVTNQTNMYYNCSARPSIKT